MACLVPSRFPFWQASRFPLEEHVPLPALKTRCGVGYGLAACPTLGLLVTSDARMNTLSVWGLPDGASGGGGASGEPGASAGAGSGGAFPGGGSGGGLRRVCTLGGAGSVAPMQFEFEFPLFYYSGYLALTPPTPTTASGSSSGSGARPLLLVTDAGHDAVHLVDVVGRAHAGYLAPPGAIAGPRGVAASGASPLVAVSAWKEDDSGDHVVVVYRGSGAVWEAVRVIGGGFGGPGFHDGQLYMAYGLRFSREGSSICVTDYVNDRVSMFRVIDGGFVRHMATRLSSPTDVEEVEGGWLVACWGSDTVEFVSDGVGGDGGDGGDGGVGGDGGGRPSLDGWGSGDGNFRFPTALAAVPCLGLVVREYTHGLHVFATPDALAMAAMSPVRVAWMAAVARAVLATPPGSRGLAGRATWPR
jgi:hypothetical protein